MDKKLDLVCSYFIQWNQNKNSQYLVFSCSGKIKKNKENGDFYVNSILFCNHGYFKTFL